MERAPAWPRGVAAGRGLSEADNTAKARVCVLGNRAATELFPSEEDAVGQTVRINGVPFTVIGVYKKRSARGPDRGPEDFVVHVPLTTAMERVLGVRQLHKIEVTALPGVRRKELEERLAQWLRNRHRIGPNDWDDFRIYGPTFILEGFLSADGPLRKGAAVSASVAVLAAAGIVFNVMMVAVKQRRREFAVKRALGATRGAIASEVVGFAAAVGVCAGGVATLFLVVVTVAAKMVPDLAPFSPWRFFKPDLVGLLVANGGALVLAVVVSTLVARRAVKVDPAAVLRE